MALSEPKQRPSTRRRRGFSLIELLAVIGIIAILTAILTVGITSVRGKIADRSTKTRLDALDGFLAAYAQADAATGGATGSAKAKRLPTVVLPVPGGGTYYSTVDNQVMPNPGAFTLGGGGPLAAPDLTDQTVAAKQQAQNALALTQGVLSTLLRVPNSQKAFDALPTETKTAPLVAADNPSLNFQAGGAGVLSPPLMVDANNVPILYVPPTGLAGLAFADGRKNVTLVAADGRAFWASAGADKVFGGPGPDGNYGTADDIVAADDNVYSTPTIVKP